MKTLQDVGLTEKDIALSRWSIFDRLTSEERIAGYLHAALLDIEEGECDASFIFDALTDAAKARTINQLAKETGLDRKLFYLLLVGGTKNQQHRDIDQAVYYKRTLERGN